MGTQGRTLISVAAIPIYLCVGVGVADEAGTTDVPGYMPSTGCSKGTVCAADQTLLNSLLVSVPEAIGVRCNPNGPQLAMDSYAIEQQISDDEALDSELTKVFDHLYSTESASSGLRRFKPKKGPCAQTSSPQRSRG